MLPVLELARALFLEAQISLVHQGRALQGVVGTFLAQVIMRDPPKLVVDEWEYGGQGFVVAGAPVCQEFADGVGRKFWHPALQRKTPKNSTIIARNAAVYLLKQRHFGLDLRLLGAATESNLESNTLQPIKRGHGNSFEGEKGALMCT